MLLETVQKIESFTDPNEDRRANELEYVLLHLRRARQEVIERPRHFAAGALEKIDRAIACVEQAMLL